MNYDFGNIVHVYTITVKVQLAKPVIWTRIIENAHSSHLISND
jgi:hypothetical protein